jgi:hypothetical protein
MRRFVMIAIACGVAACGDSVVDTLPIVGIWEMDTSRTRYLAAEQRRSETFRCSTDGKRVRCAFLTDYRNGMIVQSQFDAILDGPRVPVKGHGLAMDSVQLSYKTRPVLEAKFFVGSSLTNSWRVRRSAGGDTLVIDGTEVTDHGTSAWTRTYRRVRAGMP